MVHTIIIGGVRYAVVSNGVSLQQQTNESIHVLEPIVSNGVSLQQQTNESEFTLKPVVNTGLGVDATFNRNYSTNIIRHKYKNSTQG